MGKKEAPTMKDVAAEAGVALGTVSKVFNGIPVGEKYKLKVEEAAKKLGYTVNNYARGMRTNKTNTVAIIMPELNHPFFAELTDKICQHLEKRGYHALIAVTNRDENTESKCIAMVRQQKADGIIALTYNPDFEEIGDIPFISIDRTFNGRTPCITSDNFAGGILAAEKLSELGCKKLLFCRTGSSVPGETDKRGAGFETWCQMHHCEYACIRTSDLSVEEGIFKPIGKMIDEGTFDYDGIFCSTDHLAYHLMTYLKNRNYRIPEDIQMIGFDGLIDFWTDNYAVSTIVQPIPQIAAEAVQSLLSADRNSQPNLICLPVHYAAGPTTKDYFSQ